MSLAAHSRSRTSATHPTASVIAQKKIDIAKSGGNEYIGVLKENDNKKEGIDASGIDGALDALQVATASSSSTGPGKKVNMKALYAEFEEREIARLKDEHPGLKLSQMKERAFAAWQKCTSPHPTYDLPLEPCRSALPDCNVLFTTTGLPTIPKTKKAVSIYRKQYSLSSLLMLRLLLDPPRRPERHYV